MRKLKKKQTGGNTTNVPEKQWLVDYTESPMYKSRLNNFNNNNSPNIQDLLNTNIIDAPGHGSFGYNKEQSNNYIESDPHSGLNFKPNVNNITIDKIQAAQGFKKLYGYVDNPSTILAHELSHINRKITPEEELLISEKNRDPWNQYVLNKYMNTNSKDSYSNFENKQTSKNKYGTDIHDNDPDENKADLDALRYLMFKKGIYDTSKRDMTLDDWSKASKDKDINSSLMYHRLMQRFIPQDIINLNNTVATTTDPANNIIPIAQQGGPIMQKDATSVIKRIPNINNTASNAFLIDPEPGLGNPENAFIDPILTRDQRAILTRNPNFPYTSRDLSEQQQRTIEYNDKVRGKYETISDPESFLKIKDSKYNIRNNETVKKPIIDDIVNAAVKNGIDPYLALSMAQRESGLGNFSVKGDSKASRKDNPYGIFSDWYGSMDGSDVKSKDGVLSAKDYNRVKAWADNRTQYPFQQEMRDINTLTKNGTNIRGYNPGDPNYPNKVAQDREILMAPENSSFRKYVDSVTNVVNGNLPKNRKGGVISKTGYLADSPDKNNDFNIIPSNQITMKNVPHPVYGVDDQGNQQMMYPGAEYHFPGNYVTEVPIRQVGGTINSNTPTPFNPLTDWGGMTPAAYPQHHNPTGMQKFTAGLNNFSSAETSYLSNPASFGHQLDNLSSFASGIDTSIKSRNFQDFMRQNQMADSNFAVQPGGNRGDYSTTGSSYGMFRPDQIGAKSPFGQFNNGNYPQTAEEGGLIKAQSGYISQDNSNDYTPQFLGNSSTRELNSNEQPSYIPQSPMVGPTNTPINFPTYNNKQVSVNNNTKAAYDYYTKDKNLPSHIAAGIVGNLYQESGLKPGAVETTNTAAGRGIAQWGVNDRWQGFLNWAKSSNRDPYDLKSQLDYVLVEPGESGKALDRLKNTTTPEQAAVIFGKLYERPNNKLANWDTRMSMANKLASGTFQDGGEPDDEGEVVNSYQVGGEYEMSEKDIKQFLQDGGQLEYLD